MRRISIVMAVLFAAAMTASVALAAITTTINPANAPSGTHLQAGAIGCSGSLAVTCTSFELAGVGHTNATVSLTAHYTANVTCSNKGTNPNNDVEAQATSFSVNTTFPATAAKNGRMLVGTASVSPPATPPAGSCPNGNWTAAFASGSPTLVDFTYTLTFDGFSGAYITITGP
jgi:hypothetical protein